MEVVIGFIVLGLIFGWRWVLSLFKPLLILIVGFSILALIINYSEGYTISDSVADYNADFPQYPDRSSQGFQ